MQTFRSHFLRHGYVVVPQAIAAQHADALRTDLGNACIARRKHLVDLPLIDTIVKQTSRVSDPLYDKLEKKLQQHRRRIKMLKAQRRRRMGKTTIGDLSGDDVWAMSQKIAASLVEGCQQPAKSNEGDEGDGPTVETDHLMLAAINKHQANAWMTHSGVEAAVRSEAVGKLVGGLARDVAGHEAAMMKRPFLFADLPLFRESHGRSVAPHFTAPYMGVNTTNLPQGAACVAWLFTSDHDSLRAPVYVLANSHTQVKAQYWRAVDPQRFEVRFKPMESHTPQWTTPFSFDTSVAPIPIGPIAKGSVLLCDPHLFVAVGCNYSTSPLNVLRMVILDSDICTRVSLKPPSWIKDWRSVATDVPLSSSVVFPHLY